MQLCTTTVITGLDQREHYAIVQIGQPGWPIGLFGPVNSPNAKRNKAEAEFFAAAPAMMDMLEALADRFGSVDTTIPLSREKTAELAHLVQRAALLVAKQRASTQNRAGRKRR